MVYPLINDKVFKYVFFHKEIQKDFLDSFIEYYNNLDIKTNIISINAQKLIMAPNKDIKDYYGDLIIVLDNYTIISLEMYNGFDEFDLKKSLCYIARIYGNQLTTNEEYSRVKKVIGITLFKDDSYKSKEMLEDYELIDKISKIKIKEGLELLLVNIESILKLHYNKDIKFIKYLKIFRSENVMEMEKHSKGDKMLEKTIEYVKEFISDPKNQRLINHEESALRNAKRIGETKGIEIGKLDVAKKMLNEGISIDTINKCTGIDLKDLNKLLN